jgi:pyruvate dehydrogenase E2 component (dihydrolipoamide acetyltransferase)
LNADHPTAAAPAITATEIPDELVKELELQGIRPGTYDYRPLDGLRKLIARRMVESAHVAPHFALTLKIELDRLLTMRARLNSSAEVRISVNDFLIKASAVALARCPNVNSTFTSKGIITHHQADVAFAVAMENGLVTPIVRNAALKSIREIAIEAQELAARGRCKRLRPDEYNGGTFSISNLGMFGILSFTAIINQPHSSILSVGAAEKAYVFDGDQPRIATLMAVTLTSDHRIIDGALGAKWLREFKCLIEEPAKLGE